MKKNNPFTFKYSQNSKVIGTLLLIIVALFSSSTLHSQTMKDIWENMPDSLFPYLNQSLREECANLSEKGLTAEVTNLLKEKTIIDTLSADYIDVSLSKSTLMQARLIPCTDGDSILCVVLSYKVPEIYSSVSLYTKDWKKLSEETFDIENFVQRPDTMTVDKYKELLNLLDPYMVSARLSATDNSLLVSASAAVASKEDSEQLASILIKRKYVWADNKFLRQ